ncbi:lymphotactin-like [Rhynchocyon petersi]
MRLLILAFLAICCLTTAYIVEGVGSEVPPSEICLGLHKKPLPNHVLKSYTIKEGSMKAVIFTTKRGLKICADPGDSWVKAAVKHLDKKATTKRNMLQNTRTGA